MKEFTGWEYLLIDAANNFDAGLDKLTFEERIAWAAENLANLESLALGRTWKQRPLYLKAVMAIRRAQRGEPIGHLVGFDAVCSGMQIMSVLTGCESGALATGLVDPDRRADAYTDCTVIMNRIMKYLNMSEADKTADRSDVKQAVMTSLYGSKAEPKKVFGEDTPELDAFHRAMYELAPGPCELLQTLLDSWNAGALFHAWKLPDGYDARVKVMQRVEKRIEVDELDHATFTYVYYVNEGEQKGVKNAANVIHSIDAYVLRCLVRRCNYDREVVEAAQGAIEVELMDRVMGREPAERPVTGKQGYYVEQFERSGMADVVIVPHLTQAGIRGLSTEHLQGLNTILCSMLEHAPFPVVTVHDDFRAHPNNINWLRKHYRNILAELAESNVLDDILSQLYKVNGHFKKLSPNLAEKIRQSNYALC